MSGSLAAYRLGDGTAKLFGRLGLSFDDMDLIALNEAFAVQVLSVLQGWGLKLDEIDVFEVYNARLLFEGYNDEALRFARKYNLTAGAGSDAHVLQGVGTGALRMRAFQDPEEFLISLRTAEVLRRPKSLAYLQSLKWVAQVKERVR